LKNIWLVAIITGNTAPSSTRRDSTFTMYDCILITGGAGFVGSTLAIALTQCLPDTRIVALDNLHRRGSELNLARLARAGVHFVHGDIRAHEDVLALVPEAPGLLIECSAEPSAQAGYGGAPEYVIQTNLVGCFHCLELARHVKADVIFMSTSRVYPFEALNNLPFIEEETRFTLAAEQTTAGTSAAGISEAFPLAGARSLYGMTKLAAELMVEEYADAYGLRYIINRCGLLTGPWQMAKADQGVMVLWMAAHYFRRGLSYIGFQGTGKQVRDVLHIDDCCDLLVDQIQHFALYNGRCYNVGGGLDNSLSLQETTRLCTEITGNTIPISSSATPRPADVRLYISDHRLISSVNGWRPRWDTCSTLTDILHWLRSEEHQVRPLFVSS
jgi:CDP-paratose 2-epimerase